MNNLKILILVFLATIYLKNSVFAQPGIVWEKSLGGTGIDKGMCITQTNDQGYILMGYSTSNDGDVTSNLGEKYWIAKLDLNGSILWEKSYLKGNGADSVKCTIIETNDGGYALAAASSNSSSSTDFWIAKLDVNGVIVWDTVYGGSSYEKPFSIKQTSDNGYIVVGYASSLNGDVGFNYYSADCWIIKLDSIGNIIWKKVLGGFGYDKFYAVQQTIDGGYIALGNTTSTTGDGDISFNHGGGDLWVVKFDQFGNTSWEKCYGGTSGEGFWMETLEIIQTMDGGYVFVGNTSSTNGDVSINDGGYDAWVVKIDALGQIQWEKTFGGSMVDYLNGIVQLSDGTYIVGGHTFSSDGDVSVNNGWFDYWLIHLNGSGDIIWEQNYGGSSYEELFGIQKTIDGGLILIGSSISTDGDVSNNHGGSEDMWVVKLNGMLNFRQNSKNQLLSVVNPLEDNIVIFSKEVINSVAIKLHDTSGKLIFSDRATIKDQLKLRVDLPRGIYTLELQWNNSKEIFNLVKL